MAENVPKPIQLLPGLVIRFAGDGTWLTFDGSAHSGTVRLESLFATDDFTDLAVHEWIEKMRNNPIGQG